MTRITLCLSIPEQHTSPARDHTRSPVILEGSLRKGARYGANTLLLDRGSVQIDTVTLDAGSASPRHIPCTPFAFSASFFDALDWQATDTAYAELSRLLGREVSPGTLFPFLAIVELGERALAYHLLDAGSRGNLYVKYGDGDAHTRPLDLVQQLRGAWQTAHSSFNNRCWYSKFRADVEIEKKFTFPNPVDTWRLNYHLYQSIAAGELAGFIPEFNDEFQVWDFENHMFEVLSPPAQLGYISFIPQSNGLMTVKQKLFAKDEEVRTERLTANVELALDGIAEHARKLCGGEVRRLPSYRRKRFDVNLESLETGNVFGIFFDICRPHGDLHHALYQCEVEYLRSRTMGPLQNVLEEYEAVARFAEQFLLAEGVTFEKGFYSKLSFLRDYTAKAATSTSNGFSAHALAGSAL